MKQVECVNCGDTICIPQKGEQILNGETALEHIKRTGHPHVRTPKPWGCVSCQYLWMYTGKAERPTCPKCKGKNTLPAHHFS